MKIISGGQSGIDQAALYAAKICGLSTFGYCTKTYKTTDGDNPTLLRDVFGLTALQTNSYKERTWKNVEMSDCTVRFAKKWDSPGEICTANAIEHFKKPYLDIDLNEIDIRFYGSELSKSRRQVLDFIRDKSVVNFAGNSEKTVPGICSIVVEYLIPIFRYLKNNESSSTLSKI